jgi:hypothetical protein
MDPCRERELLTLTQRPALGSLVCRDLLHGSQICLLFQIRFHTYSTLYTIPPVLLELVFRNLPAQIG